MQIGPQMDENVQKAEKYINAITTHVNALDSWQHQYVIKLPPNLPSNTETRSSASLMCSALEQLKNFKFSSFVCVN